MTLEAAVRRGQQQQQRRRQQQQQRLTTEFSHVAMNAESGFPCSPKIKFASGKSVINKCRACLGVSQLEPLHTNEIADGASKELYEL